MPSSRAVRIEKARTLMRPGVPCAGGTWADLGCGDGIFSAALYTLIRPGGEIYAVDKSRRALRALAREFAEHYSDATLHPMLADFSRALMVPPLDGVVMANSLHFFPQKTPVVTQIASLLKPGGRLIVVEYNASRGNYAVPHPLDEHGFLRLARAAGLHQARIMTRIPSTFLGEMYSGIAINPFLPPMG
jgi:SAM-dependent methyltransferase